MVLPRSPVPGLNEPLGEHDVDGFLGGIQGGCDYQFGGPGGGFVIGIAADYAWANADGEHTRFFNFVDDDVRFRSEIDSVASMTGRLGWAWDRFLIYVKGGVAWERDNYHVRALVLLDEWQAGETRTGFTLGFGGEFAFTNFLSAFVEANWYSFDDGDLRFTNTCQIVCVDLDDRIEEEKFVVKAGLNFRFGGFSAVQARLRGGTDRTTRNVPNEAPGRSRGFAFGRASQSDGIARCLNPTTGIAGCCARATSGHATAAPPIRVMKSRRLN